MIKKEVLKIGIVFFCFLPFSIPLN